MKPVKKLVSSYGVVLGLCLLVFVSMSILDARAAGKKKERINIRQLQKELRMLETYFSKLKTVVWDSLGGLRAMQKVKENPTFVQQDRFLGLLGTREESEINPCSWLLMQERKITHPDLKPQMFSCRQFLSNIKLIHPYILRNAEVDECFGPSKRIRGNCMLDSYYSKVVGMETYSDRVDCYLTCAGMAKYIQEKVPMYEATLQKYQIRIDDDKRAREVAAKRARELALMKKKYKVLQASKGCAASKATPMICSAVAAKFDAEKRLEQERMAQELSTYKNESLLQNMEESVQILERDAQRHQAPYKRQLKKDFPTSKCEGWARSGNEQHPVMMEFEKKCGEDLVPRMKELEPLAKVE